MDINSRNYDAVDRDHRSMDAHGTHVEHHEAGPRAVKATNVPAMNAGECWYHDAAIKDDRETFAHPYR